MFDGDTSNLENTEDAAPQDGEAGAAEEPTEAQAAEMRLKAERDDAAKKAADLAAENAFLKEQQAARAEKSPEEAQAERLKSLQERYPNANMETIAAMEEINAERAMRQSHMSAKEIAQSHPAAKTDPQFEQKMKQICDDAGSTYGTINPKGMRVALEIYEAREAKKGAPPPDEFSKEGARPGGSGTRPAAAGAENAKMAALIQQVRDGGPGAEKAKEALKKM